MSFKVLQIVDTLGMGGAETWLMEVLRLWQRDGTGQMDFVATSGQAGLFDEEARQLGAKIHYLPFRRRHLPAFVREFRRVLRDGQYDAIHDHQDYISGWHFLMGAGILPPVCVTHVHNAAYQIRMNYGVTASRRMTARIGKAMVARFATHIVGTSREVIQEYGLNGPRFAGIPKGSLHCGFDTTRFLRKSLACRYAMICEFDWPQDSEVVLFAGRIDQSPDPAHSQANKNAGFAVDVAIAAAGRDSKIRLLLAGEASPAVPILEERIALAGLADRIVFAGVRRDIEHLMAGADVLLFPSRGEGLGMVAVEAQAAGLPVLASSAVPRECVVVPELVWFRDLADGPEAWVDDLLALAKQKPELLAANRLVAASAFSIQNSANALARLYREGHLC